MTDSELKFARAVLEAEARAVSGLAARLGDAFTKAVELIRACADSGGTVQISGLGKSGHVGAKISATMASLGIPSHPIHPTEAAHGDLGRFRKADLLIAISASGETDEVVDLCSLLKQDGLPIVSITCGRADGSQSSLERIANVALTLGIESEAAAPDFVAPTSSTTATMALGDALALAAARRRNFTNEDFARRHPGGSLGGLLRPVTEMLRHVAGKNMLVIRDDLKVSDALHEAGKCGRRPGAIVLVDREGKLSGIFTDGDLRRLILRDTAELSRSISEVMTRQPRALAGSAMVRDAVRMVREYRQDEIPVVDADGRPIGILDVQDLVAMRLVAD